MGGALALALALVLVGTARSEQAKSLFSYDGHVWRGLTEGEKVALLTGFLMGGALEQGMTLSPGQDMARLERLETMRREGRLRFPFAPAVYKARLEDFYFYQDRRSVPLYEALFLINEEIRRGAIRGR
ncbi:MAG: hypothetical protein HY725_20815 [Candidatus Rokubacteria bacterium]|nr:hypothetical protein [Candidatus Rokubacteria bacterium]